MADDDGGEALEGVESAGEAAADLDEQDSFFGRKGEPDYERIKLAMASLREFAESEAAAEALAAGQKEATLAIHGFMLDHRGDNPSVRAIRDAVAIIAYRRKLKWGAATRGPYTPLVQIVYPDMKSGTYHAIASLLARLVDIDSVSEARTYIKKRGGVDSIYRGERTRSGSKRPRCGKKSRA